MILAFAFLEMEGQEKERGTDAKWGLNVAFHGGAIIKHRSYFLPEISEPTFLYEVGVRKYMSGEEQWHHLHNYPRLGLSLIYADLGNSEEFGNAIAFLPSLTFGKRHRKINFYFKIGAGIAYLTNYYDDFTNVRNNVIGSGFNNITHFSFGFEHRLSRSIRLGLGGSFTHFSNGSFQLPNLGINVAGLKINAIYHWDYFDEHMVPREWKQEVERPWQFGVQAGISSNEMNKEGGAKYPVYCLGAYVYYQRKQKGAWLAGIELTHFRSFYHYIILHDVHPDQFFHHSNKYVFWLGYEFNYGHFGLVLQSGILFQRPLHEDLDLMSMLGQSKLGLKYYPFEKKRFYASFYLNADYSKAEFGDIGMGIRF